MGTPLPAVAQVRLCLVDLSVLISDRDGEALLARIWHASAGQGADRLSCELLAVSGPKTHGPMAANGCTFLMR